MRMSRFTASHFRAALALGVQHLADHREEVDALNVFPVPDGDTGTNMLLTASRALDEVNRTAGDDVGALAQAAARGALVGARGNSGVILSQFFRGFALAAGKLCDLTPVQLARALRQAAETAYQAVMKPVEGTMLSVGRALAQAAERAARETADWQEVARAAMSAALASLARTPEQLPLLRQAGVVDAGAQGLVYLLEGLVLVAQAATVTDPGALVAAAAPAQASSAVVAESEAKSGLPVPRRQEHMVTGITESPIAYGYCTEFLLFGPRVSEETVRQQLSRWGDSVLVVGGGDLFKIHVHTNHPGEVLEFALRSGREIGEVHVNNMRAQNREAAARNSTGTDGQLRAGTKPDREQVGQRACSVVAVAAGEGIARILTSLGVDQVVSGGQTMNPSAQDLLEAIERSPQHQVVLLPNNGNVIMTAKQAAELSSKEVFVVPTRSVPEGIGALLAFRPDLPGGENARLLTSAAGRVRTGEVTYAVRDAANGSQAIRQGDYLGIADGELVSNGPELVSVVTRLLERLVRSASDCITLYYGEGVDAETVKRIEEEARRLVPKGEVDVYYGGQPLYFFYIAVE